jgi:hypothetical protein
MTIARWLEIHGRELDAIVAKQRSEGHAATVEGVVCDMLDQALEVFLDMYEVEAA